MISRQELEGKWTEVKGRVQERWGRITEDDLQEARGNANQLVGVIEQKTGESRRAIEEFLDDVIHGEDSPVRRAQEAANEYAHRAGDAVREQYDQMSASMREGYEQAEDMVRTKPVESVAVAFGAGVITGVVLGLVLRSR